LGVVSGGVAFAVFAGTLQDSFGRKKILCRFLSFYESVLPDQHWMYRLHIPCFSADHIFLLRTILNLSFLFPVDNNI